MRTAEIAAPSGFHNLSLRYQSLKQDWQLWRSSSSKRTPSLLGLSGFSSLGSIRTALFGGCSKHLSNMDRPHLGPFFPRLGPFPKASKSD